MKAIIDYLNMNYMTLIILISLVVLMIANRDAKIKGTGLILLISAIIFIISIAEYGEVWVDENNMSYRILFYKAMLVYWLYPLVILLMVYVIEGVKHRLLIAMPQIINMLITALDLKGTSIVYYYTEDHLLYRGPMMYMPFIVEVFYVAIIFIYSFTLLKNKIRSKGIILGLMAIISIICEIAMINGVASIYLPPVLAMEVFTYYFYLAAIQYNKNQEAKNRAEIELERNKCNLLMAQIRPHFINSNLAVIRGLCYEDSEKAIEVIDHFSDYLLENIKQIDDTRLVPFKDEMESVENYLYLENQRFGGRLSLEKNFEYEEFNVPPLSLQTIVENAVRHGISMTDREGTIWMSTRKTDDEIIITIRDDGKGFDVATVDFDGVKHVGIKNVKNRYKRILNGEVKVVSIVGKGTRVTFRIPISRQAEIHQYKSQKDTTVLHT